MTDTPFLLIVTGHPGSGKTTLARRLAKDFKLPLIYKDGIKERLFDDLGWSDREWSRKLGKATYTLLYYQVEVLISAGVSCIAESNFWNEFAKVEFGKLQEKYPFRTFQIQCFSDGETLLRRFKKRAESDERHPGHVEPGNYDEYEPYLLQGIIQPVEIGGSLYPLDTTNFDAIDYKKMYQEIQRELKQ